MIGARGIADAYAQRSRGPVARHSKTKPESRPDIEQILLPVGPQKPVSGIRALARSRKLFATLRHPPTTPDLPHLPHEVQEEG